MLSVSSGLEGYSLVIVGIISQIFLLYAIVFLLYQVYNMDLEGLRLSQLPHDSKGRGLIITGFILRVRAVMLSGKSWQE